MHFSFLVLVCLFYAWSITALPCDNYGWNSGQRQDIILSHPVEEEIFLVTFSEDGDDGDGANPGEAHHISADALDHSLSGEVVDSVVHKEISANVKSDPLPSNVTEAVSQQTEKSVNADEDVGLTTDIPKVETNL